MCRTYASAGLQMGTVLAVRSACCVWVTSGRSTAATLSQESNSTRRLSSLTPTGICNPKNYINSPHTSKSTVEELYWPIPSLFRALTEGEAPINMMVVSFPVLAYHKNLVSLLETIDDQNNHNVSLPANSIHASYDNTIVGSQVQSGHSWWIVTTHSCCSTHAQVCAHMYMYLFPVLIIPMSVSLQSSTVRGKTRAYKQSPVSCSAGSSWPVSLPPPL